MRNVFPVPDILETQCPRLDSVFKASAKPEVKNGDVELARIQAYVLDPVGPMTRVLHAMDSSQSEDQLSLEEAWEALSDAIRLLGNASSQISRIRRKRILKSVNPDIADMAEEDTFEDAAPDLFGTGFERRMKDRAKSLKLIAAAKQPPGNHKKPFHGNRPTRPQSGGGQVNRGGGKSWWSKRDARSAPKK